MESEQQLPQIEMMRLLQIPYLMKILVSCVQIIEGIESKFDWDGKIQEVTECKLTVKFNLKDTERLENKFIDTEYDIPQWVYWSADTYSGFHEWVR